MMVIGAKTPAMIKAITAEVESKNFIVASRTCMSKARGRACYRLSHTVPVGP